MTAICSESINESILSLDVDLLSIEATYLSADVLAIFVGKIVTLDENNRCTLRRGAARSGLFPKWKFIKPCKI